MTALASTDALARVRPRGFRRLLSTELKLFAREPMLLFWGSGSPSSCSSYSASRAATSPSTLWATSS
jgi:hypothetical protein